jgi:hypothetical protein
VRENRVDILRAYDNNGVMVAAMMTTMMCNHNHFMVERHQRLDGRHACSKKYCNCN